MFKDTDELAEIISESLPLSLEDAYHFIDAIQKGYTWGKVDYAIAMSTRDGVIEKLMRENKMLMMKLDILRKRSESEA